MSEELFRMEGISKSFPGVKALDKVSLKVNKGEVLGLVGENGAGKSTLMKILSGVYRADEGEIFIEGKKVVIDSVSKAHELGISIIMQELNMCGHLSVADNIFIGRAHKKGLLIDDKQMHREAKKILDDLGIQLSTYDRVGSLSVAKQQMVEIAKAISFNSKILVLDEPTATLTEREIDQLFGIINRLKEKSVGMVYISHPTENGTLYTKDELKALYDTCQKLGLPLFLDGARLGYGLMSEGSDLTWKDVAAYTDVFYIGGTKVGALFGEAVVITNPALKKDFRYMIKQRGGMLAKGRLLGIQFLTLLEDGLYEEIAGKAVKQAMHLKEAFLEKGYPLFYDSYTNQQFPIIPKEHLEQLKENYSFELWSSLDDEYSAVRFCTSWATKDEDIEKLIADLDNL